MEIAYSDLDSSLDCQFAPILDNDKRKLSHIYRLKILQMIKDLANRTKHTSLDNPSDYSIFSGMAGKALLWLRLYNVLGDRKYLERAEWHFLQAWPYFIFDNLIGNNLTEISFLKGQSGYLAVGAVLNKELKNPREVKILTQILEDMLPRALSFPIDNLLIGKAGYLYSLLFVERMVGGINVDTIRSIVKAILESGKLLAKCKNVPCPLLYCHDKEKCYLGAAYGMTGVLQSLFLAKEYLSEEELNKLVLPTIEFFRWQQGPQGNFPPFLYSKDETQIHWYQGAAGFLQLMVQAYLATDDEAYLTTAGTCSKVIWNQALNKKNYGLFKGACGYGYAMLSMFRFTQKEIYLYRAFKLAEYCAISNNWKEENSKLNLFEGILGVIYYLVEILDPMKSRFPGFDLATEKNYR